MAWRLLARAGERKGRPIALRKPAQATIQGHNAASMCCSHATSSRHAGAALWHDHSATALHFTAHPLAQGSE